MSFADFHLVNKSLPWDYNFRFVIEEVNSINDKDQVRFREHILTFKFSYQVTTFEIFKQTTFKVHKILTKLVNILLQNLSVWVKFNVLQLLSISMYFAVSWLEPRLQINASASEWTEARTGPTDVTVDNLNAFGINDCYL